MDRHRRRPVGAAPPQGPAGAAGAQESHRRPAAAGARRRACRSSRTQRQDGRRPCRSGPGARDWSSECVNCHGADARGGSGGPNLVRSALVLHDRYGSGLGPFLKEEGHAMQSGKPSASLTEAQVVQLSHFLRQRLTDTLRGSPLFDVKDILIGHLKAGAAYFNGEGKCSTCHSATGDLAGIGTRAHPGEHSAAVHLPGLGRARTRWCRRRRPHRDYRDRDPAGKPAITGARSKKTTSSSPCASLRVRCGRSSACPARPWSPATRLQFHIDLLERLPIPRCTTS